MEKILLLKRFMILALLSCCSFLSGTEVIQRSTNADIELIVVEKDNLIIKSKGKTYTFKFSELLKTKTTEAKKHSPKNLREAFSINGAWCVFKIPKSKRNRLKYIKRLRYKVFKEGELLERVLYKGKYYARDLNKDIYEPHWEVKKDFSLCLIDANQYFKHLNIKEKTLKETIQKLKQKISKDENTVKIDRERYIIFLKDNSITTMIDKKGSITIPQNSAPPSAKLKRQLRIYSKNIRNKEKKIRYSMKYLKTLKFKLHTLQKLQSQTQALYEKHSSRPVLSKN